MAEFPSLDNSFMWQHTWPSADVLCEFIATNPNLWCGASILEIGAGVAALPSMTALRCGAARVVITEQNRLDNAFEQIRCNLERNFGKAHIGERVRIMGLDWLEADESLERIFAETPRVDFIFGSDVFYDPCVFESLVLLLQKCFDRFPRLEAFIAYQIRDSDWSLEELLAAKGLRCSLIRCVDTDQHSICLAKFSSAPPTVMMDCGKMTFAGIEGQRFHSPFAHFSFYFMGATHSNFVLINSTGPSAKIAGQWDDGPALNCLLNGVERTADQIATWMRCCVRTDNTEQPILLPIASLGMGLSGAENEGTNRRLLAYLKAQHGDLAHTFLLTSDSVAAAATSFENGGVVLIAGTGSACRLLKANGEIFGVGGWGHLIGDGGGGFWVTMRAIKRIFDAEDGLLLSVDLDIDNDSAQIVQVKKVLLEHFALDSKLGLLDILYNPNFNKSLVASFCKKLAEVADGGDAFAAELFSDAGKALAQHLVSISRHCDAEMLKEVPVVVIGSVFKSWHFMKSGFERHMNEANAMLTKLDRRIQRMVLYQLECSSAVGAAILGAKQTNCETTTICSFGVLQSKKVFEEFNF